MANKPFGMDRPVESLVLRKALKDIQKILDRYDLASYVMLVDKEESAWTLNLTTSWSAIYPEPKSDLGFRIRSSHTVKGDDEKLRLAAHTFVNILRAGEMTAHIAASCIKIMENHGIHVDFSRDELPNIDVERMRTELPPNTPSGA